MKVKYSSNNSGGNWWLEDKDWFALEAAGWEVQWYKDVTQEPFKSLYNNGKFFGALAAEATREGLSLEDAVTEWRNITGADETDPGCPCCGQPHRFTLYDDEGNYVTSGPTTNYTASWE